MSKRIFLPSTTPIRDTSCIPTAELWSDDDQGLILCWEKGRQKALEQPDLSRRAIEGELPELCWARGSSNYLAYWQGLRGDDLLVDKIEEFEMQCSISKRVFAFGGDRIQRSKRQIKLDSLRNRNTKSTN